MKAIFPEAFSQIPGLWRIGTRVCMAHFPQSEAGPQRLPYWFQEAERQDLPLLSSLAHYKQQFLSS